MKNIDKLVKARMDLPVLTYNKTITVGGLTDPLDIPNKGYVDKGLESVESKNSGKPVFENINKRIQELKDDRGRDRNNRSLAT